MGFFVHTRYGAQERYSDDGAIPSVVEGLLEELETEQFEEPDNEHAEISVNYGQWGGIGSCQRALNSGRL
jgi:hypothetical protein